MPNEAASAAAVAGVIADLIGDQPDVEAEPTYATAAPAVVTGSITEQPANQPVNEAPAETAAPFEIPSYEADTSGLDFLDEPDEEEEPAPTSYQAVEEDEEPAWDDDDEKRQLKAQLKKMEKQLAWTNEQRVNASKKTWKAEAERRFPLADVEDINADSRRAFLRKAAESHNRYAKKLAPITEALDQLKEAAVADVKTQARAEAQQAWGKPTSGPNEAATVSTQDEEAKAALDRRNHRNPYEMLKARFKYDPEFQGGI